MKDFTQSEYFSFYLKYLLCHSFSPFGTNEMLLTKKVLGKFLMICKKQIIFVKNFIFNNVDYRHPLTKSPGTDVIVKADLDWDSLNFCRVHDLPA